MTLLKRFQVILLVCWPLIFCFQSLAAETPHYLFKVEKAGQQPSWIMGTQHQAMSFSGFEGTEAALSSSDTVIVERLFSDPGDGLTLDLLLDYGIDNGLFARKDILSQKILKKKACGEFFYETRPRRRKRYFQSLLPSSAGSLVLFS